MMLRVKACLCTTEQSIFIRSFASLIASTADCNVFECVNVLCDLLVTEFTECYRDIYTGKLSQKLQ